MTALKKKPKTSPKPAPVQGKKSRKLVKRPADAKPARTKRPLNEGGLDLPKQMADAARTILDSRKAEEIITIHLGPKSSVADYMIVASASSSRQIIAIAHYLEEAFLRLGIKKVRIEGRQQANWVLVDGGDVIVHLFRPEVRKYYNLEQKWVGAEKRRPKTKTRAG